MSVSLEFLPGQKSKTPSVQTLGVLLFVLSGFAVRLAVADCMPSGAGEVVTVERVYDGDTVKLADGRHVRLLGVNAPEVNHGGDHSEQALGKEARQAAEHFFQSSSSARLFYDHQLTDRYGRTLAHIYDLNGTSLAASLLRQGLAFHIAIPPNLSLNDCLAAQESIARKKGLGVWVHPSWQAKPAAALTLRDTGFQRITGRVISVVVKRSVWLELDGPVVIQITEKDQKNFATENWKALEGRSVEVRGWVVERSSEQSANKPTVKSGSSSFKSLIVQPRISSSLAVMP